MNLREFYQLVGEESEDGKRARRLLDQQHWYSLVVDFDPRTGQALTLGLDRVLYKIYRKPEVKETRDRLWRLVEHSRAAVDRIITSLAETPRREQAILPISKVRELTPSSFEALSRRPGRNIREKLADKPYMQAVRRYQSVDIPQNQLFKEFVTQVAELLEIKKQFLGDDDQMISTINRWLRTAEAKKISRWKNLAPNNSLLSHRDYRRIWDAWKWLQEIDTQIDKDLADIEDRAAAVAKWESYAKKYAEGKTLFGNVPVFFDYESFFIEPWCDLNTRQVQRFERKTKVVDQIKHPVCVDLTYVRPRWSSVDDDRRLTLDEKFVWQRWRDDNRTVDIDLFDADSVVLRSDNSTITFKQLFSFSPDTELIADPAAHKFTQKLGELFGHPTLIWLVPDVLNDFQLQTVRRNLNTEFANAIPLPRSIAAVFEMFDYSNIETDGFRVLVVDVAEGTTYATILIARYDKELLERVPETKGFSWERSPHVVIGEKQVSPNKLVEVSVFDAQSNWQSATGVQPPKSIELRSLSSHSTIGKFDHILRISGSPVRGGIRLHQLQELAGDIPLWRDHIPELSIKVIKDGRYQPFILVDRETAIRPVRGVPVPIPVINEFTLPADREYYQFPLFQGDDPNDLGFVARLQSPQFPQNTDLNCRLTLTYTYGADDPYRLVFEVLDSNGKLDHSVKPMQVKWLPKKDEVISDAPAPEYPRSPNWSDLSKDLYDPSLRKPTHFTDWVLRETFNLNEYLYSLIQIKKTGDIDSGIIKTEWKARGSGPRYTFVTPNADEKDIFINERSLLVPSNLFPEGTEVFFITLRKKDGRIEGKFISDTAEKVRSQAPRAVIDWIHNALYVPYIKVWSDGRSLDDTDCDSDFKTEMKRQFHWLSIVLLSSGLAQKLKNEIKFLMCCTHKDMPDELSAQLISESKQKSIDVKSIGFALGDLSAHWQQEIFQSLMERVDAQSLKVFSIAIWRHEQFVKKFSAADLDILLTKTVSLLRSEMDKVPYSASESKSCTKYCELLLGLLRSRESSDMTLRMILQPNQAITVHISKLVDDLVELTEKTGMSLKSRVQIDNLPFKPEGDHTSDLLFALQLYLTGDIGANAIRVTSINDASD